MTNKEKLIKFIELKHDHIKKITGINYAEDYDYDHIKTWSDEDCERVYELLMEEICECYQKGISENTCIWCIYNNALCENCNYGMNHGVCYDNNSLYSKYFSEELKHSLTNEVYRNMIDQIEKT